MTFASASQVGAVSEATTLLRALLRLTARRFARVRAIGANQEAFQLGILAMAAQGHHAHAAEMCTIITSVGMGTVLGGLPFFADVLRACQGVHGAARLMPGPTGSMNPRHGSLLSGASGRVSSSPSDAATDVETAELGI